MPNDSGVGGTLALAPRAKKLKQAQVRRHTCRTPSDAGLTSPRHLQVGGTTQHQPPLSKAQRRKLAKIQVRKAFGIRMRCVVVPLTTQ